jgi:hypothetical protein
MHGGTISSGRSATLAVSGLYSISWNSSSSKTTAPSVVATLRPTSNCVVSVWDTCPWRRSFHRSCMPWTMLWPPVSSALRWASGLKAR